MSAARQKGLRPFSVTLVILAVFLLGLTNGWRVVGLLRQEQLLLDLGVVPDPRLQMMIALFWAALWLILTIALWQKRRSSRALTPVVLLVYAFYQLALQGTYAQAAESVLDQPAVIALYSVTIVFTTWALNRPKARLYFEGGS